MDWSAASDAQATFRNRNNNANHLIHLDMYVITRYKRRNYLVVDLTGIFVASVARVNV